MREQSLLAKVLTLGALAAVALAAVNEGAIAEEIKLPVDDPFYGAGLINTSPDPGEDPRVSGERTYGNLGGRRELDLGPVQPLGEIRIPVRDGYGLLDWMWRFRLLLDFTSA